MDNMQRGFSCAIVLAILAAHLANAYRPTGYGQPPHDWTYFGHPLEEEPILKATSPKIAATTTTIAANTAAAETSAADNALLTTAFTELLTSTPEAPISLLENQSASAQQQNIFEEEAAAAAVAQSQTAAATGSSAAEASGSGAAAATPVDSASAASSSASATAEHDDDGDLMPAAPPAGKRRIVTYDQRQEGQYNVRADLENFMIVLIPPTGMSTNLLDLLRKQQQRHTSSHQSALKKRHHFDIQDHGNLRGAGVGGAGVGGGGGKYRNAIKIGSSAPNANYVAHPTYGSIGQQAQQTYPLMPPLLQRPGTSESRGAAKTAAASAANSWPMEFIEGRTPYHVDISASDDEQSHLHVPDRQLQLRQKQQQSAQRQTPPVVDVLPPPYTPYTPFHLDVEPTLTLQALPPADVKRVGGAAQLAPTTGNFLETYSQLLNSGLNAAAAAEKLGNSKANRRSNSLASGRNGGYYRVSRSILDYDFFKGNQLDAHNSAVDSAQRYFYPIYRAEQSAGAAQLYPPLDEPQAPDSFIDGDDQLPLEVTSAEVEDDVEVPYKDDLASLVGLDYGAMDKLQAKRLLERCSPGMRRDSYGQCRKIEGY